VDDPSAGSRPDVHWLVWEVPADRTEWPAGVPGGGTVAELDGAVQATDSRGTRGTPVPVRRPSAGPPGYRLTQYALGTLWVLGWPFGPGAGRSAVESAVRDRDDGVATLGGTFDR
jgi:hypothetical protein